MGCSYPNLTYACTYILYALWTWVDSNHRASPHMNSMERSVFPLSYRPICCGQAETRTRNLLCIRQVLSNQLRYLAIFGAGKQNRTAIPSMASWCTNRCAIPAKVVTFGCGYVLSCLLPLGTNPRQGVS